jgi:hypothetical protein
MSEAGLSVYIKSQNYVTKPSDTIVIPAYVNNYSNTTSSLRATVQLTYALNTDLLTPLVFIPSSNEITADPLVVNQTTAKLTLHFSPSFTYSGETELGHLYTVAYVTNTTQSDIFLSGNLNTTGCSAFAVGDNAHITESGCGVNTLSNFIGGRVFSFSIYPNPAANVITIESNIDISEAHYTFYDQLGREVSDITSTRSSDKHKVVLDVANLRNGMYLLKIYSTNMVLAQTTKVLVEH